MQKNANRGKSEINERRYQDNDFETQVSIDSTVRDRVWIDRPYRSYDVRGFCEGMKDGKGRGWRTKMVLEGDERRRRRGDLSDLRPDDEEGYDRSHSLANDGVLWKESLASTGFASAESVRNGLK